MKSKTLKKFSAIFLSVIMVMTMMPAMAFAEETATEDVFVEDIVIGEDSETPVIVYPTVDYTDVAPFLEPVEGVTPRMMRMMAFAAQAEDDNGLILDKYVSDPDENDVYTLTLESYATGSKVTTAVTEDIPTDIVLVLDQSGSMSNSFTSTVYDEEDETSPSVMYEKRQNLYVKLSSGGYSKVTVNRKEVETETSYVSYSNQVNNRYYSNRDNLYHKCADGSYGKVNVTYKTSGFIITTYTYTYTCSNGCTLGTSEGYNSTPTFDDNFYRQESVSVYEYTFSYQNENGEVISETIPADGTVPNWDFYVSSSGGETTRLTALKSAVTTFASAVEEKAKGADKTLGTKDDIDHTISVVGFASGGRNYNYEAYENTEVFIGSTAYKYGNSASNQYANIPQDMSTQTGVDNVEKSIAALSANGATCINLGMEMANGILKANAVPAGERRNRVVIVFTDGSPTSSSGFENATANAAISGANSSKNTYGATVYTVGIFSGADASNPASLPGTSTTEDKSNRFMHLMSSNYLNATSLTETGSVNSNLNGMSYYLSASDSNALNNIFQQISENIESGGSSITLDENAVVKDVITEQFVLPEDTDVDDIVVYTSEVDVATGNFNEPELYDADVSISEDGRTVSVTNFNFAENWVGTETKDGNTTYRGKKLIIQIPIIVRDGFLGGNKVLTNAEGSGVYENAESTEAIESFVSPTVDVEIADVDVNPANFNVYLLGGVSSDDILANSTAKCGEVNINLDSNAANFGLESWQNAYVDISKPVSGTLNNLEIDTPYTLTCTVAPKTSGDAIAKTKSKDGNIAVFKPVATFKDSTVYYGDNEPASFDANKDGNVAWRHFNGADADPKYTYSTDDGVAMTGTAPTVDFVYNYMNDEDVVSGKIATKEDIPVNVTASIDGANIEKFITYVHSDCEDKVNESILEGAEFVLHVDTCKLTIVKTGGAEGEPYIFNVLKKNGKDYEPYTSLTIVKGVGDTAVELDELPVGQFKVVEDESWSWRYNPDMDNDTPSLSADNPNQITTCTNRKDEHYWLDDFTSVITNVFKVEKVEEGGTANE